MPIPGGGGSTPADVTTTSSDGVLSVRTLQAFASVLIRVDFTAMSGTSAVDHITVTRGDGATVRSVDGQFAPLGVGFGMDHEIPLGESVTYTAVGVRPDGTTVTSSGVTVQLPGPSGGWVKSLRDPALSQLLTVRSGGYPQWKRTAPTSVAYPIGARFPSVGQDTRKARTGDMQVLTFTQAQDDALDALLSETDTYLFQPDRAAKATGGRRDFYAVVQDSSQGSARDIDAFRVWTLSLVEVDRPDTDGWNVVIPGHTLDDLPSSPSDPAWAGLTRLVDFAFPA